MSVTSLFHLTFLSFVELKAHFFHSFPARNDKVKNTMVIICSLAEWIEALEVFGVADAADEAAARFLSDCWVILLSFE